VTQTLIHFSQGLDPYTAAYFVFVTLTTIGFGDVTPEQSFKGKLDPSLSFIRLVKPRDLKGQCHEIFCFRFLHESPSPKPLIITVGSFRIVSKIRGDIRKSRCTTGVNDTGGKIATVLMEYSGAGGKLIHEKNQKQKSRDTVPLKQPRVKSAG
jgi:hypothetical protein